MPEFFYSPVFQRALYSLITILTAYVSIAIIRRMINKQVKDLKRRHAARKTIVYIFSFLTILIIAAIWVQGGRSLATLFGVVGAGLTLALHQPVTSIAGWLLLLIRRPYTISKK